MRHLFSFQVFSLLLCVSFLLQVGGVPAILAQEKGKNFPIGGMVSRGEVKFEAGEKIWQKVEPSYFPIFEGSKIKTENGSAIISLKSDIQIEMGANTVLFFDRKDQIQLFQGNLNFRINSPEGISIRVGSSPRSYARRARGAPPTSGATCSICSRARASTSSPTSRGTGPRRPRATRSSTCATTSSRARRSPSASA